jgi:hypothetical protein
MYAGRYGPWSANRVLFRSRSGRRSPAPELEALSHSSLRCGLQAGRDQRIVRRGARTTRCRALGRKSGRISGGAAIGDQQHLIVAALSRATGGIAVRADDPHGGGRSRGTRWSHRSGLTSFTRGSRRPRITLGTVRTFPARRKGSGEGDHNHGSIQLTAFQTRTGGPSSRVSTRMMPAPVGSK